MKKVLLNTLAITALFGLMSNACDDLVEDLEVDVPVEIEKTINFDEPAGEDVIVDTIIVAMPSLLDKYDISSVEIDEISYSATFDASTSNDATLALGFFILDNVSGRYSGGNITNLITDKVGVLQADNEAITVIEDAVSSKSELFIVYGGEKTGGSVKGSITLKIKGMAKGKLE